MAVELVECDAVERIVADAMDVNAALNLIFARTKKSQSTNIKRIQFNFQLTIRSLFVTL